MSENLKRHGPVIGVDGGPNFIIKPEIVEDKEPRVISGLK